MDDGTPTKKYLGVAEYVSFGGLLLMSTVIGIYFAYRDRKDATIKNYYFGGKNMNPLAVGLSLAVTFQSAVVVIAAPAETYISGSLMFWEPVVRILVVPVVIVYFIPIYHRLQLCTVYQYLGMRFNTMVRRIASAMLSLGSLLYVGAVIYMPAAALNAVTPLPLAWSIILTGGLCTFYTALGGMKAVIWTDVLQSGIMIFGIVALFIKGLYTVGGFGQLLETIERGERLTAFRFDYGIISRLSPISMITGILVMGAASTGFEQSIVQRYQSCESIKKAQCALLIYVVPTLVITLASVGNGLIMYAYYEGCDPVMSGKVQSIDQGIPYMALEIFESMPGMAGLFVSAIFSASLSTISSSINSLSVLILEDFVVAKWPNMSERVKIIVGKSTVAGLGVLLTAMAFGISASKSNVFELVYGFTGLIYGPIVGLYIMGFFMPWVTTAGAMSGVLISYAVLAFMYIGRRFFNVNPYLDNVPTVSIEMCENIKNSTYFTNVTTTILPELSTSAFIESERSFLRDIYNINFNFLMFISFNLTVVIGVVASFIIGHTPASEADPRLFIPLFDNNLLPSKVRKFFRLGVPEIKKPEVLYMSGNLKELKC